MRTPRVPVNRQVERRAPRKPGRRFEDQAVTILQNHSTRLAIHRRSVLLFYLLFGLLTGFFLGLAGAKGVLANTVLQPVPAIELSPPATLSNIGLDSDRQGAAMRAAAVPERRYASLPQLGTARADLAPGRNTSGVVLPDGTVWANKAVFMGVLAVILALTLSLSVMFWRHLNRAYTPTRKVKLEWSPPN